MRDDSYIHTSYSTEKLHLFYLKWAVISKQNAPIRKKCRMAAEEMMQAKIQAQMRKLFEAMKEILVGKFSTKQVGRLLWAVALLCPNL